MRERWEPPGWRRASQILEAIRRRARLPPGRGLALGIGDDCAIYRPRGAREDLLFTTDLLLEDVHFRHATHPPEARGPQGSGARIERHRRHGRRAALLPALAGRGRARGPALDRPLL